MENQIYKKKKKNSQSKYKEYQEYSSQKNTIKINKKKNK